MTKDHVKAFLKALGGDVTGVGNNWVTCRCIFAPFTHSGGVDNHPSSGMKVSQGESFYNCYTCGERGSPYAVYKKLKILYGANPPPKVDFKNALQILSGENTSYFQLEFPEYDEALKQISGQLIEFPEMWWDQFKVVPDHPYLAYRGVSPDLALELDIRIDYERSRVVFPIRDFGGVLRGAYGRTFLEDAEPRYFSYSCAGKRNPTVWLGEDKVDLDKPVVLLEGQFDYARLYPVYSNCLAGQTSALTKDDFIRISSASEIITLFDRGIGGDKGRKSVSEYFTWCPVIHLVVDEVYGDVGESPPEYLYKLLSSID